MKGTVISVPLPPSSVQLPLSPDQEAPYVIQLIEGAIIQVSPFLMDDIVDCHDSPSSSPLPNWIGHKTKVMYLRDGEYNKGYMIFDQKHCCWRFSSQRRNGVELWGVDLHDLVQSCQQYIDDGILLPGWHTTTKFLQGLARHVSVVNCQMECPASLHLAMQSSHSDKHTWLASYKEEYDGLVKQDTFDIIDEETYRHIHHTTGKLAIPSMGILSVKKDATGNPLRAKSCIVVLGNRDPTEWSKSECYAPVVALPMVRMLTALAVKHKTTLKQGDCKNAFVQSPLPADEVTIIRPPSDCPISKPRTYWHLKKSLYGLRHAPRHWYNLIRSHLESPEIGLHRCPNEPCCFCGTPIPGKSPLYLVLYVDDFIFFSPDPLVEQYFESAMQAKLDVEFMGMADWFLGTKFDWQVRSNGSVHCWLSQEAYAQEIITSMGLTEAVVCPKMTPFRSGLPIDAIPEIDMSVNDSAPLLSQYRTWVGMLQWMVLSTRPDMAPIVSLLASYQSKPSPGHLDAAKHVGRYLKATATYGLTFSSNRNKQVEAYVHFH